MEKEYILSIATAKEIVKAEKLQQKLYSQYNSVQVLPYGIDKIKIIASGKIK